MVLACWWWRSRYEEGRRAPRSRLPCAWYGVYYFIEQVQPNPCRCCDDYLSPASSSSAIESCRVTDPPVSDTQVDAASTDDISVAGNQDAPSSRSPGERGGRLYMGGTDQAGVPWMSWNALAVWDACESWWRFIHRTPLEKFWSVSASHLGRTAGACRHRLQSPIGLVLKFQRRTLGDTCVSLRADTALYPVCETLA